MQISHYKLRISIQRKLVEYFVLEVTARSAADLLNINSNSAALFYRKIRQVIDHYLSLEANEVFAGQIELDESYFGGVRKGKRGRGAGGKVAVLGILKRGGKVFTVVVDDTKSNTLMPIIAGKIAPDSIVYTDNYRGYNALNVSNFYHKRINHSKLFAKNKNHINGMGNFWNQSKKVLRKYNIWKYQLRLTVLLMLNNLRRYVHVYEERTS